MNSSSTLPRNQLVHQNFAKTIPLPRRYQQAIQLVSERCQDWYDAEGNWIHPVGLGHEGQWINPPQPLPPTYTRLAFWLCMGLFRGSEYDQKLCNSILRNCPYTVGGKAHSTDIKDPSFSIFVTNHSMQMLALHGDKLDQDVRSKVENWARIGFSKDFDNRNADLQFQGFNDNMPAKATLGLVLGGEYFDNQAALEHGIWNLRQLASILTRRGLISEYNSPTYTPFTLVNLTVVAQHAANTEARELATLCCERIWADILAHFHRPTGLMGGPFSRAYHFDSAGHLSTQSFLLWLALDELVLPNPLEEFQKNPIELLHAHGFAPESLGRLSWVASCDLNPPQHLLEWARSRQYPFTFQASAERGGGDERYCSEVNITQHQEADFSLGTAEGECWSQLQSEVFYLTYRKHASVKHRQDVRVAYTHYLINDEAPTDPLDSLQNHGHLHTLQDKRDALVLARPNLKIADQHIHKLRLCLIIPEHFGPIEKVEQDDRHVFIEDGSVRYAIRALNPSDWGGASEIKAERIDNYLLISLENYNGEARKFSKDELKRTLNGFAFSIAPCSEETTEEFKKRVLSNQYLDYWYFGTRTICCQNEQTKLEFSYAPGTDHVRYATINGQVRPTPQWQAAELPAQELPFINNPRQGTSLQFPYKHLKVNYDPKASWCINDHPGKTSNKQYGSGWRTRD